VPSARSPTKPASARDVNWHACKTDSTDDWKPMPTVGIGVREIRVHARGEYRVIYVAKFPESIYVLHAFQKKTQRTPQREIDIARARFRALIEQRKKT
jgi:phage-related protein